MSTIVPPSKSPARPPLRDCAMKMLEIAATRFAESALALDRFTDMARQYGCTENEIEALFRRTGAA